MPPKASVLLVILVRLALITGMRRDELSGLRWDDIKDDRIVLDAQYTKTGAAHEIPLTELTRDQTKMV